MKRSLVREEYIEHRLRQQLCVFSASGLCSDSHRTTFFFGDLNEAHQLLVGDTPPKTVPYFAKPTLR